MPLKSETLIVVLLVLCTISGIVFACPNTGREHNCPDGAFLRVFGDNGRSSCGTMGNAITCPRPQSSLSSRCSIRRTNNVIQVLENGRVIFSCVANTSRFKKCIARCNSPTAGLVRGTFLCTLSASSGGDCTSCTGECNRFNPRDTRFQG